MKAATGWWFDAATWVEGEPPSGAGATLNLADKATALYAMTNDVTLGHIVYPASNPNASLSFTLSDYVFGTTKVTDEYPSHDGRAYGVNQGKTLTFDAGASTASFADYSTHGNLNTLYWFLAYPIQLKSDLLLKGVGSANYILKEPAFALAIGGDIKSDDGKHGLTVDVNTGTKYTDQAALFGENSDFTGDVHVNNGTLRLVSKDLLEHEDTTPLGHDNNVYVAAGTATIDIEDHKFGKTQHLYIGGAGNAANAGSILSSYSDVSYWPEWKGKVTLTDNAIIGGYASGNGVYGGGRGNLLISGDIDDGANGYSLTILPVNSMRAVKLTGQNTYSGGTILSSSAHLYATEGALGTGPVTWSGGVYHYEGEESCDIVTLGVANKGSFNVNVPDGVTYTPATTIGSHSGFNKYGGGTIVLAHDNPDANGAPNLYGGTVVLDYSEGQGRRMDGNQSWTLYEDAKLVVRGLPAEQVTVLSQYFCIGEGAWAEFTNESESYKYSIGRIDNGAGCRVGIASITTPENFVCGCGNGADTAVGNPGFCFPNLFYKRTTWVKKTANNQPFAAFEEFADAWSTDGGHPAIDITSACSTAPDGATASVIRFNDPTCGTLTLEGDATLGGGTILVTENMGSTPVTITGGRLFTGDANRPIMIVNMNTNATVTVESDLAVIAGSAGKVCAIGPGKIVFKGANSFLGKLYINNTELTIDNGAAIGTVAANNNDKLITFTNGGKLVFDGTMMLAQTPASGTGLSRVGIVHGRFGAHFAVPDKDDVVTFTTNTGRDTYGNVNYLNDTQDGITIEGPGKIVWVLSSRTPVAHKLTKGAVLESPSWDAFMHGNGGPRTLTLEDGARIVGGPLINASGSRGTSAGCDAHGSQPTHISGSITYDLNGQSGSLGYRLEALGGYCHASLDGWIGSGTVTIVDTAAGSTATVSPNGFRSTRFSGKLIAAAPFSGRGGMELPDAEFVGVKGVTHWFQSFWDNESVRFGALSGDGEMKLRINAWNQNLTGDPSLRNPCLVIGRDKPEETCVWNGSFDMGQHNKPASDVSSNQFIARGAPRIVKVGTNKMKITNADSWIVGSTIVRGGDFLVGNDSLPTEETGYKATLGKAMVLVGDDKTEANAVPQLLIDGEYTVANDVNVPSISDATALPGVGGNATCAYTGTVKVFRRTALVAKGADTVVTFDKVVGATGEDGTQAPGLVVKGDGKVVIKSVENIRDFGCDGLNGQIIVEGDYVIPEGAKFVFTGTIPAGVDAVTVLTANSVTGSFASVEGLPDGWTVKVRGNRIIVTKVFGLSVIVR